MESDSWIITNTNIMDRTAFLGFQYVEDAGVPEKAVEEGGFFSANKWQMPYTIAVQLAKGGTADELSEFLAELRRLVNSLELVELVIPAGVFTSANIYGLSLDWNNDEHGARLCVPTLMMKEIRPPGYTLSSGGGGGGAGLDGTGGMQNTSIGNSLVGDCNDSTSCGRLQALPSTCPGMTEAA